MSTDLRLGHALGPQAGGAVALVLGRPAGGAVTPPASDPNPGALRMSVLVPWASAPKAAPSRLAAPWRAAARIGAGWGAPWASTTPVAAAVCVPWAATNALSAAVRAPWAATGRLSVVTAAPWAATVGCRGAWVAPWQMAAGLVGRVRAPWLPATAASLAAVLPWGRAVPVSVQARASASGGRAAQHSVRAPWQRGLLVESIGGPLDPLTPPAPPGCWVPEEGGSVDLVLGLALRRLGDLLLTCRRAAIRVVPVRRVYMVTNVTTLVRASDGAAIPCLSFSLSLDVDSWAWGFSASLPADVLSMIEPSTGGEPVELLASVNGTSFRVIAESMARERTFGRASVRVQGRGHTALLDAPYSALQTFSASSALTTQQLTEQALPSGWTADYGPTPWLVPGGVWSHQGTPITAALAIAAAAGAYVQPHATSTILRVLPRYPAAPWSWAGVTPDVELPAAVVTREGIEWVERARHNRVYVSGTNTGVLGRVTRAGTAGDVVAQMVTDALITHVDGARQRGLPVLAEGGRKAMVTLRLPVLPETGVLQPGAFVRYVDGGVSRVGLVRSTALDVSLATVWQTIKVESHVN